MFKKTVLSFLRNLTLTRIQMGSVSLGYNKQELRALVPSMSRDSSAFRIILFIFLFLPLIIFSKEQINFFNSKIVVHQDGSMTVTEKINITLEKFKRGIFRDFPTAYKDKFGNHYNVKFDVISVTRDKQNEPFEVSSYQNGFRTKIGRANSYLHGGDYTYKIKYVTKRQIGFFKDHDELYWNFIGNGWPFVIKSAFVKVILPENANIERVEAYTGAYGLTEKNYTSSFKNNVATFELTKPLMPYDGFTIVVGWPKGFIKGPGLFEKIKDFFSDNIGVSIFLFFFVLVLLYYLYVRKKYCAEKAGTIIPMFEPPQNLLPADVRFILRKGFDNKCFSSSIVDMAVKGYLLIEKVDNKFVLKKIDKESEEEIYKKIHNKVFQIKSFFSVKEVDSIIVGNKNSATFLGCINTLSDNLEKLYDHKLFKLNREFFALGLFLSVLPVVIAIGFDDFSPIAIFIFVLILLINVVFFFILPVYTEVGKKIEEHILGFKMFLSFTEKERLKYISIPERTPEQYETFLPYAIALDVEENWTQQFATLFDRMQEQGTPYMPYWYIGSHRNFGRFNSSFARSFSNSFTSSISSASRPPGSRSGFRGGKGGGGFSGGGGGGGGGGSW